MWVIKEEGAGEENTSSQEKRMTMKALHSQANQFRGVEESKIVMKLKSREQTRVGFQEVE